MRATGQPAHNLLAPNPRSTIGEIMDCQDYSTMPRLLRTAYVLRAVRRFKNSSSTHNHSTALTSEELADAERLWIIHAQLQLNRAKCFSTWQRQLDPYIDGKSLWRCGGRLANADIPYSTKHPVLLPEDHSLTSMIVWEEHDHVRHIGVKETLTEIKTKFWIVKGQSLVRSVTYHCVVCRRFEGPACRAQPPTSLPEFRLREEPPFSFTGVDFAGSLYVHSFGMTATNKVWICLFTCCVTQAVHLDIVTDMSTDTFMRCLKRCPKEGDAPQICIL